MILGFVREEEFTALENRIALLEFALKIQKETNIKLSEQISILNSKIQSLNEFSYNMGGDIALLHKTEIK